MNTNIFDRSTLPITVTESGKEIVAQCETIINQVEGMIAPFKKKRSI
jgi:DNA-binding transcriptional LysR family regulator